MSSRVRNNIIKNEQAIDALFKKRQNTFIDAVMKATPIDKDMLMAQLTYKGNMKEYINIDLGLEGNNKNQTDDHYVRWACFLYFQFMDMIHDHPAKKSSSAYSPFNSWDDFCNLLERSNMYNNVKINKVRQYVQQVIYQLFIPKTEVNTFKQTGVKKKSSAKPQSLASTCKSFMLTNGCFMLHPQNSKEHPITLMLGNILRIMIFHSHMLKGNVPVLMKGLKERSIILDIMKYLSRYGKNMFAFKRKDVQTRVQGFMAYGTTNNLSDRGNAMMSLDMTSEGRLKDFGGNYYKYVHTVNLGDAGVHYLPERNVKKMILNILKKDDTLINERSQNTENILFNNLNNTPNKRFVSIHSLHYDDTPIKLSMGELKVYAYNEYKTKPTLNQADNLTNILNPVLRFVNIANNVNRYSTFATSKELDSENNPNNVNNAYKNPKIDYETLIRNKGYDGLYTSLLSKHLGDFMNSANCIRNNVIFASGDRFACVGYIITYILMSTKDATLTSKLFWEDATNDQVVFVTTPGANMRHFDRLTNQHLYSSNNKNNRNKAGSVSTNVLKPPSVPRNTHVKIANTRNIGTGTNNKNANIEPVLAEYVQQEYDTIFGDLNTLKTQATYFPQNAILPNTKNYTMPQSTPFNEQIMSNFVRTRQQSNNERNQVKRMQNNARQRATNQKSPSNQKQPSLLISGTNFNPYFMNNVRVKK